MGLDLVKPTQIDSSLSRFDLITMLKKIETASAAFTNILAQQNAYELTDANLQPYLAIWKSKWNDLIDECSKVQELFVLSGETVAVDLDVYSASVSVAGTIQSNIACVTVFYNNNASTTLSGYWHSVFTERSIAEIESVTGCTMPTYALTAAVFAVKLTEGATEDYVLIHMTAAPAISVVRSTTDAFASYTDIDILKSAYLAIARAFGNSAQEVTMSLDLTDRFPDIAGPVAHFLAMNDGVDSADRKSVV